MSSHALPPPRSGVRLTWTGKERALAPARGGPPSRVYRSARGAFLHGDNLTSLASLTDELGEGVTLAYLDPPFLSGKAYDAVVKDPSVPRAGPLKARPKRFAFDDRWESRGAYLEALGQRLVLVRELLAAHGSVVVHVDTKASHYVKVLGDEIFGEDAFVSEIIWRYRRWPSKTPNYQRVHDVLLRWRKDPRVPPRFNQAYEPLAPSTLATWGTTKQRAVVERDGRRSRSSRTTEETKGVPLGDVWDIGVIAPVARERTGYPSQKPEALLERLVTTLTDEGEVVLDPYAGSGTTLAVAARLGRRFVGCDQSEVSLETVSARLEGLGERLVPEPLPRGAPRAYARTASAT